MNRKDKCKHGNATLQGYDNQGLSAVDREGGGWMEVAGFDVQCHGSASNFNDSAQGSSRSAASQAGVWLLV